MREPRQTEQPEDVSTSGESYQGIVNRIGRSIVAGIVATGVLWVLKSTRVSIPQLDTIRLDPVVSLVYHIIYGVTLAGVYTLISGRRVTTR